MPLRDSLLPELDQELATTRRVLEAVTDEHAGFRPHEKSWTMGELALHTANVLAWLPLTLLKPKFDLADPDAPPRPRYESAAALLATFDKNAADARGCLAIASDRDLEAPWSLERKGQPLFKMPRIACIRSFVMNHMIHHRGQLTVYLRLCDVPVPEVYGPTADSSPRA